MMPVEVFVMRMPSKFLLSATVLTPIDNLQLKIVNN